MSRSRAKEMNYKHLPDCAGYGDCTCFGRYYDYGEIEGLYDRIKDLELSIRNFLTAYTNRFGDEDLQRVLRCKKSPWYLAIKDLHTVLHESPQ